MSIIKLLNYLGNPHQNSLISFIHITGTKAKTSVCYYTYELILKAGYRAGLFVSPHVYSHTERIQYNGEHIKEKEYETLYNKVKQARAILGLAPHFFEDYLAVAFLFFREKKPAYVVLEVGIGGLLDSTNVIDPVISVISVVGKDHQEVLGKSLQKILSQKLGIIKPNRPFLIGKQTRLIRFFIFFKTFKKRQYRVKFLNYQVKELSAREYHLFILKQKILLKGPEYMVDNFILSYHILNFLGIDISFLKEYTHTVSGRFEIVSFHQYTVVLDGAHNALAFKKLVSSLRKAFPFARWNVVFMAKKTKILKPILKILKPITQELFVSNWEENFGSIFDSQYLLQSLKESHIPFSFFDEKQKAKVLNENPYILVTGSFYHLGWFKKKVLKD
jgi:dihydrofolate synthase/folylpolyglutamate synthase